ncbi:MAG: MoaD/ThiS family protein [Bacteroidetes bacterium]|nr:MoaD/ThiS family protein [Bacteroidota bacterium]MDA1121521.1 MoaD/ThiS family protein [Bacteroidota bacterium]
MAIVKFTANLKRFYPELEPITAQGETVAEVLREIENHHKGIKDYIVDEADELREHVNIFIGNELIKDREKLGDAVKPDDEIYIMQALSGG